MVCWKNVESQQYVTVVEINWKVKVLSLTKYCGGCEVPKNEMSSVRIMCYGGKIINQMLFTESCTRAYKSYIYFICNEPIT